MNNFNRVWSSRRRTLRNIRTRTLISPVWKYVEYDAFNYQQVNCKHYKTTWVNLNGSNTALFLHLMRHHNDLLTEAERQIFSGQCSGWGRGGGSGGGRGGAQSTPLSATKKTRFAFASEDNEPNGLKDLESEFEFKLKLDSQVKQSNSSTDNENHDRSNAIYNVKVTGLPWFCIRCS